MRRWPFVTLAAAALGAGAVWMAFAHDMDDARARLGGRGQTLQTSFGRMEYARVGQGEPVLSIHGAGGGFDQGLDMTGALAGRGYQVIAPSRFGYLGSAMLEGLTTEMQADAYAELLDHLGLKTATVVGISAGAWSSIQFAARHPDRCRALVLLVPAGYLPEGKENLGGPLVAAMFKSDFVAWAAVKATMIAPSVLSEAMLGTDAEVLARASPAEQARARETLEHLLPMRPRRDGVAFDIATAGDRRPYPIGWIDCPVLTVSAEDDRFGTMARAREIAAAARGRAVVFPDGGHALIGRRDEALGAVAAFLATTPR